MICRCCPLSLLVLGGLEVENRSCYPVATNEFGTSGAEAPSSACGQGSDLGLDFQGTSRQSVGPSSCRLMQMVECELPAF